MHTRRPRAPCASWACYQAGTRRPSRAGLDLVARTRPGPFRARTHTMGRYLGVRLGGALIAMAGQRVNPPGWSEISAVCTDPDHRGKGLAGRLVQAVAATVRDESDVPFLHVAGFNTGAIRLYEALGFTHRREMIFSALRTPAACVSPAR